MVRLWFRFRKGAPPGYIGFVVWRPTLWLLREGWRRWGLISAYEVLGAGAE